MTRRPFARGAILATALLWPAATLLAQTPAAADSAPVLKPVALEAYERVRGGFCTNEKMLGCLGLEQSTCEANVEAYIGNCRTEPNPQAAASNEPSFLVGYFTGCAVGGALKANPSRASGFYSCLVGRPAR